MNGWCRPLLPFSRPRDWVPDLYQNTRGPVLVGAPWGAGRGLHWGRSLTRPQSSRSAARPVTTVPTARGRASESQAGGGGGEVEGGATVHPTLPLEPRVPARAQWRASHARVAWSVPLMFPAERTAVISALSPQDH